MASLSPQEQATQERYRDARFTNQYDSIWQSVGKCVFCDLNEKYVFFEEHGVVMTISLYAYIDGHFLIAPRRHIRSTKELTEPEWATIRKFTYIAKKIIKDVHGVNGLQFIQKDGIEAQSTVADHIHFHCIPFDAPNLMQWNYRKLKHTPLENVELYKQAGQKIIKLDQRFEKKYHISKSLPVLADAIIINERQEVLFQERPDWAKLTPDIITPPGGGLEDYTKTIEEELAREVREETGTTIDPSRFKLVASRIEVVGRNKTSKPLQTKYSYHERMLWNTYLLANFDSATPLTPGDDAESLMWIPLANIASHPRISPGVKQTIAGITL